MKASPSLFPFLLFLFFQPLFYGAQNPVDPSQLLFSIGGGVSCDSGFVKLIGIEGINERAWFLLPVENGQYLIGGQAGNASQLTLVDGQGNFLWQKTFDFTSGDDFIRYMILDSEGYVVMTGRDQYDAPTINFLARFDLQTLDLLWSRTFPAATTHVRFEGIMEKPGNGNYLLHGMVLDPSYNAYIQEAGKDDGTILWQREFDLLGNTDNFHRGILAGDDLYFASVLRFPGGLDQLRASIVKTDLDGNIEYSKAYFTPEGQAARTYIEDIKVQGDTLVTLSRGVLGTSDLTNSVAILMKTDLNGNIHWAKTYTISGGTFLFSRVLLTLPDGYILSGEFTSGNDEDVFFIRTDYNGNLIWAKAISTPGDDLCYRSVIGNNSLYFAATSEGFDGAGQGDILFGAIPLDEDLLTDSCGLIADLNVVVNDLQNDLVYDVSLTETNPAYFWTDKVTPVQDSYPGVHPLPGCECQDSCLIALDAVLYPPSATCQGDSLSVTLQVCNTGQGILFANTPVAFYDGNPTAGPASLMAVTYLPQDLAKDSCLTWSFLLAAPPGTDLFAVANEDGTTPVPFALDQNFQGFDSRECDYSDNMNSFSIVSAPPEIILTPEVTVALGQGVQLVPEIIPPDGPYAYAWSPPDGLSCADCPSPFAQPVTTTVYTLVVTDTSGCDARAQVVVVVDKEHMVYIPTIFSPNGDNKNDVFLIFGGVGVVSIRRLQIFDRWGEMVFDGRDLPPSDPGYGWDGKLDGRPMNPQVFAIKAEIEFADGEVQTYYGNLTLVR